MFKFQDFKAVVESWKTQFKVFPHSKEGRASTEALEIIESLPFQSIRNKNASALFKKKKKGSRRSESEVAIANMAQVRAIFDNVFPPIFRKHGVCPKVGAVLFDMLMHASQGEQLNGAQSPAVNKVRTGLEHRIQQNNHRLTI